jgi:hypothetical protein
MLLITFTIVSCKKQELKCKTFGNAKNLEWSSLDCEDSPDFDETGNVNYLEVGNQYKFPVFNPNNSNEIIYYEEIRDSIGIITNQQLIKYNIVEDSKTVLKSHIDLSVPPVWNKNGLIAFRSGTTGYITLINDDGSNQIQFSDYPTGPYNGDIFWLNNSNTLVWRYGDPYGIDYIKRKKTTEDSVKVIFQGKASHFSISKDSLLIISKDDGFETLDLNKDSLYTEPFNTPLSGNISDITGDFSTSLTWSANGNSFYVFMFSQTHGTGLFNVNLNTGNPSKLVKCCNNRLIKHTDCSAEGDKLIIQLFEKFNLESESITNNIGMKSTIWLLDLNTLKAAKLPL